jgi:hypothetical protein
MNLFADVSRLEMGTATVSVGAKQSRKRKLKLKAQCTSLHCISHARMLPHLLGCMLVISCSRRLSTQTATAVALSGATISPTCASSNRKSRPPLMSA